MKGFALDETGDVFINNLENLKKISRETVVFEGETSQVVVKGKNLLDLKTFSCTSDIINPTLSNAYGTSINTTDGTLNQVTVTQSETPTPGWPANYTNGYFVVACRGLEYGKSYTLSFDYSIIENPFSANYMQLMANGVGTPVNISITGNIGRAFCTFTFDPHEFRKLVDIRICGMSFTASNFMITEVGESTEFEPYVVPCPTPANPSPLVSKIHNETKTGSGLVLHGVGDAKDTLAVNRFYGTAELTRRCGVIEHYNGETIPADYMSTTGERTLGAKVVYVLSQPVVSSVPYQEPGIACEIEMVEGDELLAQTVQKVTGTNKGEWFLNVNEGIHFSNILIKKPIEELIRNEIQSGLTQVDRSYVITDFLFDFNKNDRVLKVRYTAKNSQGKTIKGAGEWH